MKSKTIYLLIITVFCSCASLHKATVDMSLLLEKQITVLEKSHLKLVNLYFEERKKTALDFLDNEWYTMYLDEFFKEQTIIDFWDETIKSEATLIRTENMKMITIVIQEEYMKKRESLLTPIQLKKEEMRIVVSEEYKKALTMNAAITNNVASVNDIQEKRKELLSDFIDTDRLENKLNTKLDQLDEMLNKSKKVVDAYNKNEKKIDKVINQIKK